MFKDTKEGLLKTIEVTLNLEGASFGINTQIELNGFLAQTAFETKYFNDLDEEVERYTLKNIRALFKRVNKYSDDYIKKVMEDKFKLSLFLYDNENKGIDYRGRGLIHTTWWDGYNKLSESYNKRYGIKYDFTKTPTLLSIDNLIAVRSALIFFEIKDLFTMENKYNINNVSKTVNPHDGNSFPRREALFQKINSLVK